MGRNRYRTDPAFKDRQKKLVRLNYWRRKAPRQRPTLETLRTNAFARIRIDNENDLRHGQTVTCPVYRVRQVATVLGISPQSVKIWIRRGRLPEPTFELDKGERRDLAWTYDQLRLIWEYVPLLDFPDDRDVPPKKPQPERFDKGRHDVGYKEALQAYEKKMEIHRQDHAPFSRWLHEDWASMPDGVLPIWRQS